jgi:LPS export ABC transporter permease LptG/LPS export ABC transporter permease LptF
LGGDATNRRPVWYRQTPETPHLMRTLDRYLLRELLAPFFLALSVFTFILAVQPMLEKSRELLSKGVDPPTVAVLIVTLIPQALGLTIPMAVLAGLLMALGKLSGDRESVALLACGVSPMRILAPILAFAMLAGAADMYVMIWLIPDSNQRFRVITTQLVGQQTESDVKAGLFYTGFPGKVLYVNGVEPGSGWSGVFVADTTQPTHPPTVTLAEQGHLVVDQAQHSVDLWLSKARQYQPGADPTIYDVSQTESAMRISIPAESVFGAGTILDRGLNEMSIAELRETARKQLAAGVYPHNEYITIQQKFSFPVACVLFGIVALALGLHTRKEGKLAGMTLGLVVIAAYYGVMEVAEGMAKSHQMPAIWARWVPNILLAPVAGWLMWKRTRAGGISLGLTIPDWIARRFQAAGPSDSSGRRVVVVLRLPHIPFPRPRLLDIYVSLRYLRTAALAFIGFLVLYYIGTVVDLSDKLFKGNATAATIVSYLYYSTPQFVTYIVPIAILVGVLTTFGSMTRSSELTVMRACGVSLYRAAMPLVGLALVLSGTLFLLEENVLAYANRRAGELNDQIRGHATAPHTIDVSDHNWLVGKDGRIYYYAFYQSRQHTLFNVSMFDTASHPYRLVSHTFAQRAAFDPRTGQWNGERGFAQHFDAAGGGNGGGHVTFQSTPLALTQPTDFSTAVNSEADTMTFTELRKYIAQLGQSGFSVASERVALQNKIAFPLVTLVMTLIGVPFAVTTGRRGALYGIGLGIGLAFSYWLLMTFFLAMGSAGILPATLAAWAANVLFFALAIYLMLTVRT